MRTRKANNAITTIELGWIIQALNRQIAELQSEMEDAGEGSATYAIGKVAVGGRQGLITKLADIKQAGYKRIEII